MTFAALTIDINAKVANLESGLKRTEDQLNRLANRADSAGKAVQAAFTFVGGAALIAAFTSKIVGLVDEMANLDDAAEKTGSSVESISETFNKFKIGGGSLDELTAATSRLVKSMQAGDEESKGAGEALANLGIKTRDAAGNLRDPIEVLNEVAKSITAYGDSANKTAYAQAIFGKSGAELLPRLKDLATETGTVGRVTAEQAAAAEELQKALRRLTVEADLVRQSFLSGVIPTLINMIEQFNAGREAAGGFFQALLKFGLAIPGDPAVKLKGLREERDLIMTDIEKTKKAIDEDVFFGRGARKRASDNLERLNGDLTKLQKSIGYYQVLERQQLAIENTALDARDQRSKAKPVLPALTPTGTKSAADKDPAKAIEALAKERTRIFLDEQKRVASESLYLLEQSNSMGLESIESFFDRRQEIAEKAYLAERIALDQLIAAQEESVKKDKSDPKKLAESTKELEISLAKRNALDADFKLSGTKALDEKGKATREYAEQVAGLNVQLETIKGNSVAGALAAFDKQFEKTVSEASKTNERTTLDSVASLRQFTAATAEYNDLGAKRSVIEEQLATATARNQALLTTGAITERESMDRLGEIRKAAVPDLERIAEAQKKIAEAIGNPKLLADADAFKARTEELARTADVLKEKYLSIGEGAFSGMIDDLAAGSKTAIDIAKDMVKRILLELVKLEFAGLGRKGTAGLLDLVKGFGLGGDVPFEFSGSGFALGGDPPVGKASLVGERGPELFIPNSAGTIVPNNRLGGGSMIVQNFDMRGSSDSENMVRRAAALGAAAAKADIHNDRVRGGAAFA